MATDSQSSYFNDTPRTKEDSNGPPLQRTKTSLEEYDQSFQRFACKADNFLKAFQEFRKTSVELDSEIKRAYGLEGKLSGILSKYNDVKDAINTTECSKAIQSLTTALDASRKEHAKFQNAFQARIDVLSNNESLPEVDESKQAVLDDWHVFYEQRFDSMDNLILAVLEYKLCMQRPPAYSTDTLTELVTRSKNCLQKPSTLTTDELQGIKKTVLEESGPNSPLKTLLKDEIFSIYFRMFLRKEHMEENLTFLHDAERFLEIQDPQKRIKKALEIYDTYFHSESKKELNLEGPSKQKITDMVENFRSGNGGLLTAGSSNIFGEAVQEVLTRLENDHFKRFVQSDYWTHLQRRLEKKKLQEVMSTPVGSSTTPETPPTPLSPAPSPKPTSTGYNSNSLSPKQGRNIASQYSKRKSSSLVKSDLLALEQMAAEDPSMPKVDRRKTIQIQNDMSRGNSFNLRDFARRLNTMNQKDATPEFAPSDAPLNPLGNKTPTPNASSGSLPTVHSMSATTSSITSSTSVSRDVSEETTSSSRPHKSSMKAPQQVEITSSLEDLAELAEQPIRNTGLGNPPSSPSRNRLAVSRSAENLTKAIKDSSRTGSGKNLKVSFTEATPKTSSKSKKEKEPKEAKQPEEEKKPTKKLDVRSRSRSYFVPRTRSEPAPTVQKTSSKLDFLMPWKKKSSSNNNNNNTTPQSPPQVTRNPLMLLSAIRKQEKEMLEEEKKRSDASNDNNASTGLDPPSSLERKSSKSSWGSKDSKDDSSKKEKKKKKDKKKKSKKSKKEKEVEAKYPPRGSSKLHLNPLFQTMRQHREPKDEDYATRNRRSQSLDSGLKKSASASVVMDEKEREIEAWLLQRGNTAVHKSNSEEHTASSSSYLEGELEQVRKRAEERKKKREMELLQAEEEAKQASINRSQQRLERRMLLEQESQKDFEQLNKIEEQRKKRLEEMSSM